MTPNMDRTEWLTAATVTSIALGVSGLVIASALLLRGFWP